MAHATTASASSQTHVNVDARLKNLKKNVLPDYPLRLTQVNDHTDTRSAAGNCKHCDQNKDNCFCYAHHTFLSREEMTTYSDKASSSDCGPRPPSSKSLSSKPTTATASHPHTNLAPRSGKKISLGEYSKRMQEVGSGAGRSTPKDAPSPAEPTMPKETSYTKLKTLQSSSLPPSGPLANQPDSDRPTKKLKISNSTSTLLPTPPVSRLAASNTPVSKHTSHPRSPKKTATNEETPHVSDRKSAAPRPPPSKRDISNSRPKSPSINSRADYSRNRRSQSPIERTREKSSKKDHRDHRVKLERLSKEHERHAPILPKMLSPLPDELNRLVDEYERKHPELVKDKDVDNFSMDDEPPRRLKKGDKPSDKISSQETRIGGKADNDAKFVKLERKFERLDPNGKDTDAKSQSQDQSPRQGFKVPAKRPPADMIAKIREVEKEPHHLLVRLNYGTRNSGKVKRILKSEPKVAISRDNSNPTEFFPEKVVPRERSPHLPTRVSMTTLKAGPSLKPGLNGKIATPNRRLASSSERPKSNEQGSYSRLTTSQTNDREADELGDNEMLRADSEAFLALGIKLKHKADAALGVKNPEEANLHHALVYACHCVIAYFLSFGLDDELRRREKRSSTSESWRSVVGYIEFLLSSRLKANPAIHGLLYQMGAICSERVSSFEQQRLLGISLTDFAHPSDNTGKNVLETIRRTRNDLIRILRTNHEWWNLGHQRLPWATVQTEFQKTWSKRSLQVARKPQVTPGHYLTPFYLPLYSGSTAFEAATFAWMVTQEWATQARLNLDTGLYLTWSSKDDGEA